MLQGAGSRAYSVGKPNLDPNRNPNTNPGLNPDPNLNPNLNFDSNSNTDPNPNPNHSLSIGRRASTMFTKPLSLTLTLILTIDPPLGGDFFGMTKVLTLILILTKLNIVQKTMAMDI